MKYVLFVCTHNAGRSQMAQAFFERDCTTDVPRRVRRLAARAAGLARGRRGDARGRDRPRRPQAQAAVGRDAAARRLGGDDGLRRRLPLRPHPRRRLGHPRPRRQVDRGGARDPRPDRGAGQRARPEPHRRDPIRSHLPSMATRQAPPVADRGVRRRAARPTSSAAAPTESSTTTTTSRSAATSSRSPTSAPATACATTPATSSNTRAPE